MRIRFFTLFIAIFILANVSFAQSVGSYKARKTETITKKQLAPQQQGFFIMPEVAAGRNFDSDLSYDINGVFGYVFNNHFALGIGIGYNSCTIIGRKATCIPFYLNLHGDFSKNKVSPYYSLDLGFRETIKSVSISNDSYDIKGPIISPELGLRFNNCYIGANLIIGNRRHLYYYDGFYRTQKDYIINLKFGYKILFK